MTNWDHKVFESVMIICLLFISPVSIWQLWNAPWTDILLLYYICSSVHPTLPLIFCSLLLSLFLPFFSILLSNDSNISNFENDNNSNGICCNQNHRLLKLRESDLNRFEQTIADIDSAFESLTVTPLIILFNCWKRYVLGCKSISLVYPFAIECTHQNHDIYSSCWQSV